MRQLAIGIRTKLDGWTTLDMSGAPDILAAMPPLPAAARGPWDRIEWIHGPGYVPRAALVPLLRELRAALAPGGVLVMEQPNIMICARNMLAGEPEQMGLLGFYGDSDHGRYAWGWTPRTLGAACVEAGFRKVAIRDAQHHVPARDFRIEAAG